MAFDSLWRERDATTVAKQPDVAVCCRPDAGWIEKVDAATGRTPRYMGVISCTPLASLVECVASEELAIQIVCMKLMTG